MLKTVRRGVRGLYFTDSGYDIRGNIREAEGFRAQFEVAQEMFSRSGDIEWKAALASTLPLLETFRNNPKEAPIFSAALETFDWTKSWEEQPEYFKTLFDLAVRSYEFLESYKGNKSELHWHHLIPQQLKNSPEIVKYLKAAELNIEDFKIPLEAIRHTRKPFGIHTGPENWNKEWLSFFEEYRKQKKIPSREEILEQLDKMIKKFGL